MGSTNLKTSLAWPIRDTHRQEGDLLRRKVLGRPFLRSLLNLPQTTQNPNSVGKLFGVYSFLKLEIAFQVEILVSLK